MKSENAIRLAKVTRMALATAAVTLTMTSALAQLTVIDPANVAQTTISAAQNVAQTLKQIQQYQTQLQQYQNMLQNTAAPTTQIWDRAQATMNQLRGSIDTLNHYKATLGGIDAFLAKTKDTAGYRATPCYSYNGCTGAEWAAMRESERFGSEAQKRANDALFKGLDMQQDALQSDAGQLQRLQASAQGASGQMQAMGYANQFASHQANQLLQIRALLVAQQNVMATRNAAIADREAKESASWDRFTSGAYRSTPGRSW
jgi:P-type conjugative transfer protein TrbJ